MPDLPPIGAITEETQAAVIQAMNDAAEESRTDCEEWATISDDCANIYTWGDTARTDDDKLVVNDIRDAVLSVTNIQMREPPSVTLGGTETGEAPEVYWVGPANVAQVLMPMFPMEQAWFSMVPFSPDAAKAMTEAADLGIFISPAGQIPFKEDWIEAISDRSTAEFYQTPFDVLWERSKVTPWLRKYQLDNNIQGWNSGLYEFDDDLLRHELTHLTIRQVYLDPLQSDISRAAYAGVDFVLDARAAMKLYPGIADKIEKHAGDGQLSRPDRATDLGAIYDRTFKRKMVVLRVFWFRNEPVPMTPEEALGAGKVEQRDVPTGQMLPTMDPATQMPAFDQATGQPMQQPETRPGLFMGDAEIAPTLPSDDGTPGDEPNPQWPVRYAIRQLTALAGEVVDDRECEHADIPLLHVVAIPLPGAKPYGLGLPWALRNLQRKSNSILNNAVDYARLCAHPGAVISRSMADELQERYGRLHADPRDTLIIDDDIFQASGGKVSVWNEVPAYPESNLRIAGILQQKLTERSGNQDVLQGKVPGQMSGRAIESLQQSAVATIEFQGESMGQMVKRLGELMLHSVVNRLTPEKLAQMVSKPMPVIEAYWRRGQRMEWDLTVSVSTGGAAKAQKQAEIRENLKTTGPDGQPLIDTQTAREGLGLDHRKVKGRLEATQAKLAMMQPVRQDESGKATPAQPAGQPGGKQ